jgi:hypothetical protein
VGLQTPAATGSPRAFSRSHQRSGEVAAVLEPPAATPAATHVPATAGAADGMYTCRALADGVGRDAPARELELDTRYRGSERAAAPPAEAAVADGSAGRCASPVGHSAKASAWSPAHAPQDTPVRGSTQLSNAAGRGHARPSQPSRGCSRTAAARARVPSRPSNRRPGSTAGAGPNLGSARCR